MRAIVMVLALARTAAAEPALDTNAGVRIRCEAFRLQVLKIVVKFALSGRRAPRIPALVRIRSLLR